MVEQVFTMTVGNEKTVERVIQDENLHYMHMILGKDEGLPVHNANSNVYMTVLRGTLSIDLDDRGVRTYAPGTVLKVPFRTKMDIRNLHDTVLEITVVKAPAPQA